MKVLLSCTECDYEEWSSTEKELMNKIIIWNHVTSEHPSTAEHIMRVYQHVPVSLFHMHAEPKAADTQPVYEHEGLQVDLVARSVWLKKEEVHLSPMQFNLLAVLVRNAGRAVSQQQLMKEVWGEGSDATSETLRTFIHQLRYKIEPDPLRPRCLKTVAGVGYRLESAKQPAKAKP